ncbi:MAG: hypothetical protein F6K31_40070, partial [Symploca sp. SIO2G7]|nr:hypothetical protein [Symploca sp. SIO2G7]
MSILLQPSNYIQLSRQLKLAMSYSLPPEDLPPEVTTAVDLELGQQLDKALCRVFFEACDGSTQALLMVCRWSVCISEVVTLNIQ